jgi:hypothetical protein
MTKQSGSSGSSGSSGEKKAADKAEKDGAAVKDLLAPFNAIPGGLSAEAFAGAAGMSESEASKTLQRLADEGKLTAQQPMGGPMTYFMTQPDVAGASVPEGGPPEMGSIDERKDIDTRPVDEQLDGAGEDPRAS